MEDIGVTTTILHSQHMQGNLAEAFRVGKPGRLHRPPCNLRS